jgi:hypothetical protein
MTNVVYVGGFGSGRSSTERVANTLGNYYEGVEAFRFSDLQARPDDIRRASADADIVAHSAGALALKLDSMEQVDNALLLGPPLPQRVSRLLYRTVVKTARMNMPGKGIQKLSDVLSVTDYSASTIAEVVMNPIDNLGRLKEIAATNTVDIAAMTRENHIPTTVVWTPGDAYFKPTGFELYQMRLNNAHVVTDIDGEHDEVILRPEQFLSQVYER